MLVNLVLRKVGVAVTPENMKCGALARSVVNAPLISSPECLDLRAIAKLAAWGVAPELRYMIEHGGAEPIPPPPAEHQRHIHHTLHGLLSESAFEPRPRDQRYLGTRALLDHYADHGVVQRAGDTWSLTPSGRQRVVVGHLSEAPKLVMTVRDIDPIDMSMFELITSLETSGWRCALADRRARRIARAKPYVHGTSEKVWYSASWTEDLDRKYFVALAAATPFSAPVPHLGASSACGELLSLQPARPHRKKVPKLVATLEDEWEQEEPMPVREARKPRRRQAAAKRPAHPREHVLVDIEGDEGPQQTSDSSDAASSLGLVIQRCKLLNLASLRVKRKWARSQSLALCGRAKGCDEGSPSGQHGRFRSSVAQTRRIS